MTIPVAVQHALAERLERQRREHCPDMKPLTVRFRGNLVYVARKVDDVGTEPLFRLGWRGSEDDWAVAVWSEPEQSYVPNGDAVGTPEDALRRASDSGLGRAENARQRSTRWALPSPVPSETHILRPYVRAVRRHKLFVVLFVLGAVLGSVAIIMLRSPTYTAHARLLVTPVERGEAGALGLPLLQEHGDPTRTIETAAAVVENPDIAAAAAAELGGGWTSAEVLDAVDVAPQGQTNVLDVAATADDPETAAALANAYATAVIRVRSDALRLRADEAIAAIEADLDASDAMSPSTVRTLQARLSELELLRVTGDPTVAVAERAEPPTTADGSPTVVVVTVALLVGLLLAPGAAYVIDLLGPRRLMGEDEITEVFPLAVLARVPLRRGQFASPEPAPDVRDAFRRLRAQIELADPHPRTIMITSPSDDGRQSTALNLATELAADGGTEVTLIDLDGRLASRAADLGIVEAAGQLAGLARYRVRERRSLIVLGDGDQARQLPAGHVVDAALEVIQHAGESSAYVVFHAPPLDAMTDLLRLAATVDVLIIVVRLGFTTRRQLEAARAELESIGVSPTGYVVVCPPA